MQNICRYNWIYWNTFTERNEILLRYICGRSRYYWDTIAKITKYWCNTFADITKFREDTFADTG